MSEDKRDPATMSLSQWQKDIVEVNRANGWYDDQSADEPEHVQSMRIIVEASLIASEAMELIEEIRDGHPVDYVYYSIGGELVKRLPDTPNGEMVWEEIESGIIHTGVRAKPLGVLSELVDILIRTLDLSGKRNLDLSDMMEYKLQYNATRGHKHGGKAI